MWRIYRFSVKRPAALSSDDVWRPYSRALIEESSRISPRTGLLARIVSIDLRLT